MAKSAKKSSSNHGQKITTKELALIKRLVKEQTPTSEIATTVGRSTQALRKLAFRAGISLRKKAAAAKKAKPAKKAKKAAKKKK
jgi:IS30 family transposase